jgi:hypothetical protein
MLINIVDVADGALVNAIALTGRRIGLALSKPRGRQADDLDMARWFETYRLTDEVPDLPDLSPALRDRLAAVLNGDEIQAALQELLAVRLTDAPEADAEQARSVVRLTLSTAGGDTAAFAGTLADYYDDQICALVARLSVYQPQALAQIRSEAFSTRMIAILNAIEHHVAALTARPSQRSEASFLSGYRRHVVEQHGKLEPPDFDRRRRIPIADIYVPTAISEDLSSEQVWVPEPDDPSYLDVYRLAERLDRTVLLGDPGGGKTTAANVLMHLAASDPAGRIPFLVTLRDYAAKDPPERSVVRHVEHLLETFYQCPAPPGLVDLLLLTGRAVVIFDGLDELLDPARRGDVTTRVERFCAEYPLTPVLVTSRLVGYDQARLDEGQFTCYRLSSLSREQVGAFAGKWFAQDREMAPGEADRWTEAFLRESAAAWDVRANPLMLSLLCILYRGEGSLPRDRAEVYRQCTMLMFRRWDARRRIHQDLRADRQLEPALRHLAWWLFTREDAQSAVTERELTAETTEFLENRGFESNDDARDAAGEFVAFCRGRMWVFSDAGTTATGESLYAFTHRTFLEYFAAAYLAYDSDVPEQLARAIAPRVAAEQWWVVGELAIQIKDSTSNGGARRVYAAMLADLDSQPAGERANILKFLSLALRSVDPTAQQVRELVRRFFAETLAADMSMLSDVAVSGLVNPAYLDTSPRLGPSDGPVYLLSKLWGPAFCELLASCGPYRDTVADQLDVLVSEGVRTGDHRTMVSSLRVMESIPSTLGAQLLWNRPEADFWRALARDVLSKHGPAVAQAAETDAYFRTTALRDSLITTRQALDMAGGPVVLFYVSAGLFVNRFPYFQDLLRALEVGWPAFGDPKFRDDLAAFGEYITDHPEPPWLRGDASGWDWFPTFIDEVDEPPTFFTGRPDPLSQTAYLGAAAMLLILHEVSPRRGNSRRKLGPLRHIAPYLARREGLGRRTELPSLLVPEQFKQLFRDWAEGRISFTVPDGAA